jgi:hypothetical protein
MFDLDRFFADCRDALAADPSHRLVRNVVARVVSEPDAMLAAWANRAGQDQCDIPRAEPDSAERDLGSGHDDHAARPSHAGGDRQRVGPGDAARAANAMAKARQLFEDSDRTLAPG